MSFNDKAKIADWPICDLCNKPVESLERHDDHFRCEVIFIARCHGDKEVVRFYEEELFVMTTGIRAGRAFQKNALPR